MKIQFCKRISTAVLTLLVLSLFSIASSHASTRHALVIGNSDYNNGALLNPNNDAVDMANQLRMMDYEIFGGGPALNLDRIGIERTLRAFARSLPQNANALLYFAGHGIATEKDNYLIPVSHNLEFIEQLPDRAVSLKSTINLFKNANPDGINVVLLDACRDNPLSSNYRSGRQGLQKLTDIPRGVFIGYAADAGQVAKDGVGRNGTYTAELLQVMQEQPDVIIEVVHKEVARRVFEKTAGKQFPVSENKVYGDWCFGECTDSLVVADPQSTQSVEEPNPIVVEKSRSINWKVIGGVALGALIVGAAMQGEDNVDPPDTSFQLILEPPQ